MTDVSVSRLSFVTSQKADGSGIDPSKGLNIAAFTYTVGIPENDPIQ